MHNDPIYLLKPVFDWLDGLIRDQGDYLYLLLVYASIPLVAWILGGGLRRRPHQTNITAIPIIVIRSVATPPPLPPDVAGDCQPPLDDDTQSFDA